MFHKPTNPKKEGETTTTRKIAPSVISADVNLLGNLISDGLIDFDGTIHGNISCHTLVIRSRANIHGEVKADSIQVAGAVKGTLQARSVVLQNGANVEGTIIHEQITVEEGATVDGKLKKISKAPAMLEYHHSEHSAADAMGKKSGPSFDEPKDEDMRIMEHIRLIAANE